jgi:probable HAF family extracellular repeat protein
VNASGQVFGLSTIAGGENRAFLWTLAGGMTNLGLLPGHDYSEANAVNDSGQVVGLSGSFAENVVHAFSWTQAGGMIDLGTLGGTSSVAVAVNAGGQVVGRSHTAGEFATHGFSWTQASGMVDLGTAQRAMARQR